MNVKTTLIAIALTGTALAAGPLKAATTALDQAATPATPAQAVQAADTASAIDAPPVPASVETAPRTGQWQFNLGAAVLTGPRYPGSDEQRYRLVPVFEARWRYVVLDPIRGVGVQFRVSPALTVRGALGLDLTSRQVRNDARLAGLDDVNAAAALRLGADYRVGIVQFTGLASSRLGGRNTRGTTVDADVALNVLRSPVGAVNVGLTTRWIDRAYADTFFNIAPAESARSGLPAYQAGSGIASTGIFAQAFWRFTQDWGLAARMSLNTLRGDVARSPITRETQQVNGLISVAWAF